MFEISSEWVSLWLVVFVWTVFALYSASIVFWLVEVLGFARGQLVSDDELVYSYNDIQVRIITIDAESIVQGTVDTVPDRITDIRVIAEKPINIDGATVHVVPEDFTCTATHKGRALEWARQDIPCKKEFILYLDEDTLMANFKGLPDSDIVQITELPLFTGSWVTYLSEVFRIGYQREQRAFGRFRFPLYAWGGGLAIRKSLEDRITWDSATITEDTDFIWRAAAEEHISFRVLDCKFRNQAPPSLREMFKQRRRWMSGTRQDSEILPLRYRIFLQFRLLAWGLSPVIPLIAALAFVYPTAIPNAVFYQVGSLVEFGMLFLVTSVGAATYFSQSRITLLAIPWTPVLVVLNTAGALWGYVWPVREYEVTEKVPLETIEQRNLGLEAGVLTHHDGKGDIREQFDVQVATTELKRELNLEDD